MLNTFSTEVDAHIEGASFKVSTKVMKAGALANQVIYGDIYCLIEEALKTPNKDQISLALANLSGYRNNLFPDQKTFDIAVRTLVDNYKDPLHDAVDKIKGILVDSVEETAKQLFDNFPRFV